MHSLKDKVSRFFSDSIILPSGQPQEKSCYSLGGKCLHSFLSYMNPEAHPEECKPYQWTSTEWKDKCFGLSPETESRKSNVLDNDEDATSERSTSDSEVFDDVTDPPSPVKSIDNLTEDSFFITPKLYEFFQSSLPNIVKGCQWVLLYSTLKHGTSLRTLIRNSGQLSGPCLLIVGDMQGTVFGGLLECPLNPTAKRKYQGTSQSFVYTSIHGEPRLFRPTGLNRYFYICQNDMLALGGGGNFALCLDEDLLTGTSGPCETFGSCCLANDADFNVKNVELWGFTHASHYQS